MLATHGQENAVHARQTAAAGKPLNQGIRALNPKTPGNNKTQFRVNQNDENQVNASQGQKAVAAKNGLGKLNTNTFVTPAASKLRAPLGAKTTNAKAQPFKTPGLGQTLKQEKSNKKLSTTRRSVRKILVAPTEPVHSSIEDQSIDEAEPDFGYAPPPITELPDPPIEFDYNQDFPQFRPENMYRGYGEIYFGSPKDEHGVSLRLKLEEEEARQHREEQENLYMKSILKQQSIRSDPDAEVDAMIAAGPKNTAQVPTLASGVDTVKAKSAAAALSQPSVKLPSAALKQTISSMQKWNLGQQDTSSRSADIKSRGPLSVSKNTIGFPKAKKAPSIIPKGQHTVSKYSQEKSTVIDQTKIHPAEFVRLYGQPPADSEMWFRLKEYELLEKDSSDMFSDNDIFPADEISNDFFLHEFGTSDADDFQLPMPED